MQIEQTDLITWLQRLVQIPSVTPDQAGPRAGVPGEARIAAAVTEWFRQLGADEVVVEDVHPGRPNVYGIWKGRSDRWAALDVHMDTVSVEQVPGDPFSGELRDGRIHGRGSVDTKASLGVALAMLETMQRNGIQPQANLLIAATADEESMATGAPAFAAWVRRRGIALDQLMVAEPTLCQAVYGHKGLVRHHYHISGVSAHSSQPHLGKNAIIAASHLALAFEAEHQRLQSLPPATELGAPTLTVTMINGGRGLNVVPDSVTLSIDRRVIAGETTAQVAADLIALAQRACPLPFEVETILQLEAFYQSPDTPWLRQLAEWAEVEPTVAPYGTNAFAYGGLARECVVLGPGSIAQAHGLDEWVEVSELVRLADIYQRWWL